MTRESISSGTLDLVSARSVIISVADGEQLRFKVTLNWLTDLTGYTKVCKIVEGLNEGLGKKPKAVRPSGIVTTIPILDSDITDNTFDLVIPQSLIATWTVKPSPDMPVYGFIDLEVADTETGDQKQIWKPIQGLVEVSYSPTEAT